MTRFEENVMVINEMAKRAKSKPTGTYKEMVTIQLGTIATMLADISKSLAILADKVKIEGNEKETELKLHPCYCGGEMELKKVAQDGGMDGMYENWELSCKKCGLTMTYAADGFYGRKYKTFEEVIDDWNRNKKKEKNIKADVFDKIRAAMLEEMLSHLVYCSMY